MHRNLSVPVLAAVVVACGGTSAEVESVAGEARTIPEESLVMVSRESTDEPTLGSIEFLARGSDGRIFAYDGLARRVEVYDAGGWIRSIGGPGEGPGEFSPVVMGMVLLPQGLAVLDSGNGRISVLDDSGALVEEYRLDLNADGTPVHSATGPEGRLLVQLRRVPPQEVDSIWALGPSNSREFVGAVRSGISEASGPGAPGGFRLFAPFETWTPAPEGLYVVTSHDYAVRRVGGAGSEVVFSVPAEPRPVTPPDREAVREAYSELFRSRGVPAERLASNLELIAMADTIPLVSSITTSDDGDIWVQRGVTPSEMLAETGLADMQLVLTSREWDRWSPDGEHLETVTFPPRFVPWEFTADEALGVSYDELGRASVAIAPL